MCFSDTKEFLIQWEDVLNARTQQSVEQFSKIQGISGIILGGSLSTGTAWPLSDIDLILISQRDSVSPVKRRAGIQVSTLEIYILPKLKWKMH